MEKDQLNKIIAVIHRKAVEENLITDGAVDDYLNSSEIFYSLLNNAILCIHVFTLNKGKSESTMIKELIKYIQNLYSKLEEGSITVIELTDYIHALFENRGYFVSKLYQEGFNEQFVDDIYDVGHLFLSTIFSSKTEADAIKNTHSFLLKFNIHVFIPFYDNLLKKRTEFNQIHLI